MKYKNILIGILCSILIVYVSKILYATASSTELENYNLIALSSTKQVSTKEYDADNLIKLGDLKPDRGFAINGVEETRTNLFGSVSDAGDINGDGIDDIMLSTPDTYIDGKKSVGQAYVIFGSNNLGKSGNFDLKELNGTNGFVIQGANEYDNLGEFISSAGDLNNDGFDDIIVSSPRINIGENKSSGKAYVVFGGSTVGNSGKLPVSSLNGSNGFAIGSDAEYSNTGYSVGNAGDVNDDDIDDIIVGTSSRNSSYTARDYVIFGNRQIGVSGNLELSTINGSNGFIITGDGDDEALRFVSNAGDVNDDGIDDIILGAPRAGESNAEYGTDSIVSGDPPSGRGYVIFGSRNNRDRAEIKLSNLDGSNGFLMEIDAPGGHLGRSVSGAGDINADGIDDIIIGSSFVGSYIIFGDRNLGSNGKIDVSSLNGTQGFALLPFKSFLGHSVSSAGDLNADGISDLAIVAAEPKTRTSKNNTNSSANNSRTVVEGGIAYVIYGSANIEHLQEQDLFLMNRQQGLILQDYGSYLGFIFSTTQFDKSTHKSISNLGDVNGDGIDDLIVGIPGASNRADSYVIFGNRQYGANANANDK